MGLQRIFSATTAVVGLFISVDYGLCDEFRCRGTDLTDKFFETTSTVDTSALEWKPGFIWALLYITSIALWALHISLLESSLVLSPTMVVHSTLLLPLLRRNDLFISLLSLCRGNDRSPSNPWDCSERSLGWFQRRKAHCRQSYTHQQKRIQ